MNKFVLLALALFGLASANRPIRECQDGDMFLADEADLCRFHWCTGGLSTVEMRCAPGSRVPTWYTSSADNEVPCNLDRREEISCLRCDIQEDVREVEDRDDCVNSPCADGCTCQDLWQSYYCICPDDVGRVFGTVDFETEFCNPDRCVNGGVCSSQWDDYWCACPNGYTGKNCEIPFCDPNPCQNGGTCSADDINYRCQCVSGFAGPCCEVFEDEFPTPQEDKTEIPKPTERPTAPTTTETITTTTTTTTSTTTTPAPVICGDCEYKLDDVCYQNKSRCECYECKNFDDMCFNGENGGERECKRIPNLSSTDFSFVFMQNTPARDGNDKKRAHEIYVTAAGSQARDVKVYSKYIPRSSPCYFETTKTVSGFDVETFEIPNPGCFEMKLSKKWSDKMIKVEAVDGVSDILVYAVNREEWSADAWIAIPDDLANTNYMVMTYGPGTYATQFSILALEDGTEVTLNYRAVTNRVAGNLGNEFTLQAGESVQIQSISETGDLTGIQITSSKPVHAWSGNVRALVQEVLDPERPNIKSRSRDHLVEQLIPIANWGREYIFVPVPERIFGDQIKVLAANNDTKVTVTVSDENGIVTSTVYNIDAGRFFKFDGYFGNSYMISATKKVLVGQITKSKDKLTEFIHDPSLIFVPSVQQYTNRYLFSTPEFSGGASGQAQPYNTTLALLAAKTEDRAGIKVEDRETGTEFYVSDQEEYEWKKVPGSDYWIKAVIVQPGTNAILHSNQDVKFLCIFYGMDDRESLGFPVSMMLYNLE